MKRNQYEDRIEENRRFLTKGNWPILKLGDRVIIKDELRKSKKGLLTKGNWPILKLGDRIIIKDELRKSKKGLRFKNEALVKEILGFNTDKQEKNNTSTCKRHISQLKGILS